MGHIWDQQDPGGPHELCYLGIDSGNGLWHNRRAVITWTNANLLSIALSGLSWNIYQKTQIKKMHWKSGVKNIDHYVLAPMSWQQFGLSQWSDLEGYMYELNWFIPKRDKRQQSTNDVLNARDELHLIRSLTRCPLRDMEVISNV